MRTWCSPMSAASQGAFVVIPGIPLGDIYYMIIKKRIQFLTGILYSFFAYTNRKVLSSFYKAAYAQEMLEEADIASTLKKLPTEFVRWLIGESVGRYGLF